MRPSPLYLCLLLTTTLAAAQQPELVAALPDAPSFALTAQFQPPSAATTPIATGPMVNGRPYIKPTAKEDFRAYYREFLSPRFYIHAAVRSGIEQLRDVPTGWGQDGPGYAQRYASAFGEAAIDHSVRYGLGAVLHEDVRYLVCHGCTFSAKLKNAALYEVTARHGVDGHRTLSITPIASSFAGPEVAYAAWYPPGGNYGPGQAAKHAFLGIGTRVAFNLLREYLHDRHD